MPRLIICLYSLYLLLSSFTSYAQSPVASTYTDPDEIRIKNKFEIEKVVRKNFTQKELCDMKNEIISFSCELNASGEILLIRLVHKTKLIIIDVKLNHFMSDIKKTAQFHIPNNLRSGKMKEFRKSGISIPFRAYCL